MDKLNSVKQLKTLKTANSDKILRTHCHMSQLRTEQKKDKISTTTPYGMSAGALNNIPFSSSPIDKNDKTMQPSTIVDDPRALQLALELSNLSIVHGLNGLNCDAINNTSSSQQQQSMSCRSKPLFNSNLQSQSHSTFQQFNSSSQQFDSNALSVISAAVAAAASQTNYNNSAVDFSTTITPGASIAGAGGATGVEERTKKSQNMTECVPVPSSEHVAEIVGRQGCKIKALRAKTNTYIKTPVRNEEPVFVVTGRKEDVAKAKREIISAAEHFSFIRATRKNSLLRNNSLNNISVIGGGCSGGSGSSDLSTVDSDMVGGQGRLGLGSSSSCSVIPGQMTIQVRVPYRVVGLVVGPKGATIKHIQHETQTYIVTPSREKEPIFEVTGLPDNVQSARKHIEAHIALRTGSLQAAAAAAAADNKYTDLDVNDDLTAAPPPNLNAVNNSLNTLSRILNEDPPNKERFLENFYQNRYCPEFDFIEDSVGAGDGLSNNRIYMKEKSDIIVKIPEASVYEQQQLLLTTNPTPSTSKDSSDCSKMGNAAADLSNSIVNHHHHLNNTEITTTLQREFSTAKILNSKAKQQQGEIASIDSNIMGTNNNMTTITTHANVVATRSCSSASSTASSKSANNSSVSTNTNSSRPDLLNFWKNLANSLDVSEESGGGETRSSTKHNATWSISSHKFHINTPDIARKNSVINSTTISPTDSLLLEESPSSAVIGKFQSNANFKGISPFNPSSHPKIIGSSQQQQENNSSSYIVKCVLCNEKKVTIRLACGHNILCKDCCNPNNLEKNSCPVCNNSAYQNMY